MENVCKEKKYVKRLRKEVYSFKKNYIKSDNKKKSLGKYQEKKLNKKSKVHQ